MKLIHLSDIHIGSKISSIDNASIRDKIKAEILNSFNKVIDYSILNNIHLILLSGDVFDNDKPNKSDKKYFYDLIKKNPDIDFIYLKGNHDISSIYDEDIPNLKTFSKDIKEYIYKDIRISGIEITDTNYKAFYDTVRLDKEYFNILMLHGEIDSTESIIKINKNRLIDRNIDYLALGHIHKGCELVYKDLYYRYPGSLVSRGFDELDDKGFYVLDIENKKIINEEFIPINKYKFIEYTIDITSKENEIDIINELNSLLKIDLNKLVKIKLTGKAKFDLSYIKSKIEARYSDYYLYFIVRVDAIHQIDTKDYLKEESLKGEFVRTVLNNDSIDDETKSEVLSMGMKFLNEE